MAIVRFFLAGLLLLMASASSAQAHQLLMECRIDGERFRAEAFYDDDTPAQQAAITLKDESNRVIAEGKTDDRGTWSCPLPAAGKYVVKVQSAGHAATKTLTVGEPAMSTNDGTTAPWLKAGVGCGVLALLFGAIWLARRGSTANVSHLPID